MYDYITPELLAELFDLEDDQPDAVSVFGPIPIAPDIVGEAMGIVFGSVRFVVFFASPLALADGDPDYLQQTVNSWAGGYVPQADARVVKFLRAEADRATMFEPEHWPLPQPQAIWQFIEVLSEALVAHAEHLPQVPEYFFIPQAASLDSLYNRMARNFERGQFPVRFRCVTRPAADEGGFYGYQRA
ncbi:hypothetical protein [Ralstonia soli]|uniref:Uncharacterized protein n=1 Tax=Ralstonia soli TaxID=2953896 RepID=A0ABT1ADS2_9RALS|nr:hypothetical protein [Ralstonia soli]MCO5396585.1 hypothetical protein [Ralstonia soli]